MLEKYLIAFLDHKNVHFDTNFVTIAELEDILCDTLCDILCDTQSMSSSSAIVTNLVSKCTFLH